MTVRGDLETANTNLDTANSDLMTVRGDLETANTNLDTANSNLMTANSDLMTVRGQLETGNSDLMTLRDELNKAKADLMVAEGDLVTAKAALMVAEGERDAAKELARQLTMVTSIKTELAMGFDKVAAGTYALGSGDFKELDDVRIECPASAAEIPCTVVVTVSSAGVPSFTSLGGVATVVNTSAVEHTRMAIALTGEVDQGLNAQATAGAEGAPLGAGVDEDPIGVKRNPSGTTTITPVHVAAAADETDEEVKYKSVGVDRVHRINGWIGQTLTRDDGAEATEDVDAIPAANIDEATFYTNIESAESGKLKYKAGQVPLPADAENYLVFAIDRGQDAAEDFTEEFTGYYIRKSDGGKIRGTFTCNADVCTTIDTAVNTDYTQPRR